MNEIEARLRMPVVLALLAGALALNGCSTGSFGGRDDKAIIQDIQAKLYQDATLKTRDIHVDAQKGIVVLTGSVGSDQERTSAEQIAKSAAGVEQVMDELTLSPTSADLQAAPTSASTAPSEPPKPSAEERAAARRRQVRERRRATRQHKEPAASAGDQSADSAPPQQPTQATPPAPAPAPVAQAEPPAPPPLQLTVPTGSVVSIRMTDPVDSSVNRAGEEFAATVSTPVMVDNHVAIPRGANARVRLVQSTSAGHMKGQSMLELALVSVTANGATYDVSSSSYTVRAQSRGKRTAETVGGGAAVGAIIGAIAGHGKGAAIGSVIGAGAGTAAQRATKPQEAKVPSETKIDFVLKSPIDVTLTQGDSSTSG